MVLNIVFLKEAFSVQCYFHYTCYHLEILTITKSITFSFYADDPQLYISESPNDLSALHALIDCLTVIKVKIILTGHKAAREKL